jgi:hypothetical protein
MANPTASSVHIDKTLTNYATGIFQDPANLVGQVFPMIPVDKQSDKYWVWNREDYLRDGLQIRPPRTESAGGEFSVSTTSYYADVYAYHIDKGDQEAANADFDYDARITRILTANVQQHFEQQQIAQLLATGKWGTDQAGVASLSPTTNQFTQFDFTGADPAQSVDALSDLMITDTGRRPNVMVIGVTAWSKLKRSTAVKDQIKYTTANTATEQVIANLMGLDRIIVARGIKATNNKGQTLTTGLTFGAKTAWLGYVEPNPSLETASSASIFVWTGLDGAMLNTASPLIYRFEIPEKRVIRYEVQIAYDMVVNSTSLGKFMSAVVS